MHSIPGREPPKACRSQRRARRAARADAHGGEGGAPTQRAQSRGWPKAMAPPWRKVCGTAQHHHNDQNATECESNAKAVSAFRFISHVISVGKTGRMTGRRQRRAPVVVVIRSTFDVIACRTPLPSTAPRLSSPVIRSTNESRRPHTSAARIAETSPAQRSTNNLNALTCGCAAVSPRTSHQCRRIAGTSRITP